MRNDKDRKKDGKLRFCIDLRKLNNRTIKDAYALPRVEETLYCLRGAILFSALDLQTGYWQDEMEEEAGILILAAPTWNEFGVYAGGHADIGSVGSFEVPLLENESGRPAVVFGKYNMTRAVIDSTRHTPGRRQCRRQPSDRRAELRHGSRQVRAGAARLLQDLLQPGRVQLGTDHRGRGVDHQPVDRPIATIGSLNS